jgi:hypothetical protein
VIHLGLPLALALLQALILGLHEFCEAISDERDDIRFGSN